jgi:hypothetical protein
MPDWAVQQLRVSLFSSAAVHLTEARHWKLLTGQDEAENRLTIPGGKQYIGKFLSGVLNLAFSVQRCDIIAIAQMTDPTKPTLPIFGPLSEVLDKFLVGVCPFVETFEFPVVRLAFGGTLLAAAKSKEDAYIQLGECIQSVRIDPARMRDFMYRVNWPQQSSIVKSLELNRLTAWDSISIGRNLLQVTGTELTTGLAEELLPASRLEVDMNTSQGQKEPFRPGTVVPILEELVSMARENAKAGERP